MDEEVRISRLVLKPALRRENADIGSTEIQRTCGVENELAAARGPCAIYLRDISPKFAALKTQHTGLFS